MTSFFKSARHIHDVESDLSYVEIEYERYIRSVGQYATFKDYINTEPLADWVYLESNTQSIQYEKFLDAMVKKTLEVRQRMCEVLLENTLVYERVDNVYLRLLHASKILDPTFQPPRIDKESAWQVEFTRNFCNETMQDIIQGCTNMSRLSYFFNVLRTIDLNTPL